MAARGMFHVFAVFIACKTFKAFIDSGLIPAKRIPPAQLAKSSAEMRPRQSFLCRSLFFEFRRGSVLMYGAARPWDALGINADRG